MNDLKGEFLLSHRMDASLDLQNDLSDVGAITRTFGTII